MLAWLLDGDGDVVEVDVELSEALIMPDDKILRIISIIDAFTSTSDFDEDNRS